MNNDLLINKILGKIKFKIQPNENIRREYLYRIKKNFYKLIHQEKEFINNNTIFKDIKDSDLNVIKQLSLIDTMSKISIGFLINQISKSLDSNGVYVNIGVWRGFSMFAGMLNTECEVYGVDNFSFDYKDGNSLLNNENEEVNARRYFTKYFNKFRNKKKHFFFDMDYKFFFNTWEQKKKGIDFYYYDGEHSYNNQYDNLVIAKDFLKKDAIILIDDYNEMQVEDATLDFVSKFNSSFRIIKKIKTANKYIHPSFANGIVLIEKV